MEQVFRWGFAVILLSAIIISGVFRRRARNATGTIARSAEGSRMVAFRALFAAPIGLSFAAYMINPDWMAWSALPLPDATRLVALVTGLACVPLLWWVFSSIGSNISETVLTKANHQLVTHGPYHWIRHPLYTFALLAFLSASVVAANWFMALVTLIGAILIVAVVIPREEAGLIDKFGTDYVAYCDHTGALMPRVAR
jgi:protein-S-isoprenylcysteine O-methyltransferase Ste14